MLLPPRIDDYIAPGNPVRAIDAYVESLDLGVLGFGNTAPGAGSGQPPFPPAALLKLYLYGYLNRVHSSRCLEREALRNLEAIWLVQGLRPGYKTLANFRKDNSLALKAANRDFILLCKDLSLFGGEEVAVDGSFFKADASTDWCLHRQEARRPARGLGEKDRRLPKPARRAGCPRRPGRSRQPRGGRRAGRQARPPQGTAGREAVPTEPAKAVGGWPALYG